MAQKIRIHALVQNHVQMIVDAQYQLESVHIIRTMIEHERITISTMDWNPFAMQLEYDGFFIWFSCFSHDSLLSLRSISLCSLHAVINAHR